MVEVTLVLYSPRVCFLQLPVSIINTNKILPEVVNNDAAAFEGETTQIQARFDVRNVLKLC